MSTLIVRCWSNKDYRVEVQGVHLNTVSDRDWLSVAPGGSLTIYSAGHGGSLSSFTKFTAAMEKDSGISEVVVEK